MLGGALEARHGRGEHTLLRQNGDLDHPQQRKPAGVGLRALQRRRHEVSADAARIALFFVAGKNYFGDSGKSNESGNLQ